MPTERERSCTEKEIQAIRFNHNEQRCLEKKINCLKHEGSCSIKLINQTHKNIKVSYNSLKSKVSKIKTHLNVDEIDEYRKQEEDGKIQLFKSILKPDSVQRISSYAKRLNIDYDDMKSTSTAKHSDDLVNVSPLCVDDMTRKDILLRQISELNDRFNAVAERERELERGLVNFKNNDSKRTVVHDTSEHSEIEQIDISKDTNCLSTHKKPKNVPRPSTAFEFARKNSVNHGIRPATSLGKYKSVDNEKGNDGYPENDSEGRSKKRVRPKLTSSTKLRNKVLPTPTQTISKPEKVFQSVMVTEAPITPDEQTDSSSDTGKSPSKSEKSSSLPKKVGKVLRSISFTSNKSKDDQSKDDKPKLKRSNTEKSVRPRTAFASPNENKLKTQKNGSKVRPATSNPNTPRSYDKGLSALSEKGNEAIKNIIACMRGPSKAPFDCHAQAERAEKEAKTNSNILEEGRTKFLSRDCIETNLGHDLHRELRKELLQEEETNAMKIEDKICSFMDKLNAKIKIEKENEKDVLGGRSLLTMDDLAKRQVENHPAKRVNRRRQNKFTEDEQKKMEQNKYRRSSAAWKDVNKCRYLRIEESKIDLSGIKTLASDQLALVHGLRYDNACF